MKTSDTVSRQVRYMHNWMLGKLLVAPSVLIASDTGILSPKTATGFWKEQAF
jgi:hypothetical protein